MTGGLLGPPGFLQGIVANASVVDTANEVDGVRFTQPGTQTYTNFSYNVTASATAGVLCGLAFYDTMGQTVLMSTGAQDATKVGKHTVSVPSFTLNGGTQYIFSWTCSGATWILYASSPTMAVIANLVNTTATTNVVKGATLSVGGVPPASMGILSAKTGSGHPPVYYLEQ